MDEYLFELEYSDELDALRDKGELPVGTTPKSRKCLYFATAESSAKITDNDSVSPQRSVQHISSSFLEDNGDYQVSFEDAGQTQRITEGHSRREPQRKRFAKDSNSTEEEKDYFDSFQDLEPQSKRARSTGIKNLWSKPAHELHTHGSARKAFDNKESNDFQNRFANGPFLAHPYKGQELSCQQVHTSITKSHHISVTNSDGLRVHVKLQDDYFMEEKTYSTNLHLQNTLLTVPVTVLRELLEESKHVQEEMTTSYLHKDIPDGCNMENRVVEETADEITEQSQSLWVDKYAPHRYTDLLSDESVNRLLLHWLKKWDHVVFNKELSSTKTKMERKTKQSGNKKFQLKVPEEFDDLKRPIQKVALLCGSPGLGKTTLAHIVARQAGYNIVEINASDDRSVDAFRNSIESATQMKAVIGADPRPNCLIIDEIDGASQAAVNVLLGILKQTENSTGKKKKDVLLRPVICICNDQYAAVLRQLRQQAMVINFPSPEPVYLASRLLEIVRLEQLKVDLTSLLVLCKRTENDIRSCLNTLQFVRKKHRELTLHMVQTMSVGQKDTHKTLFSAWKEILTIPRPNRNRNVGTFDLAEGKTENLQMNVASPTARFLHILSLTQATGEYERLLEGLFENYLQTKSKDPHLLNQNLASEWFCFVDELNWYTSHNQDYSLMKYIPFLPVLVHFLSAVSVPQRINFPHSHYEVMQKCNRITGLLATLLMEMLPGIRKYLDIHTLTLDVLPLLLNIMQPTLRPVNTQLYSGREKDDLAHLVRVMVNYNLIYKQERTPEGQYTYTLEPNLEEVVRFSGLKQYRQLTYSAKQLIAREIELEKLRRTEVNVISNVESCKSAVPNHKHNLLPKSVNEEKIQTNFFGNLTRTKRQVHKHKADIVKESKEDEKNVLDTLVWFHFKEGYSNAVRRNVHMHNLQ
ncbi:chromosome transmission fidelity protein 18 homolog isoform X2 [Pomacea canaliculata]|uniref:chromosome transmission fidelity protein 18 homolog isoform X2 n=1 Tax=Pomacea canaliculata TaxID=400727 RepID=UPI000D73893E|nr:chromosome transmission fidelity protein 18 homolog isoform X2 [Pomacea canaliculata]